MVDNNGYAGIGSARAGGKEMMDIGLDGFDRWPHLDGFREAVERYQGAALVVAADLLRALAAALDLGPAFFADRMRRPQCFLRLLRYPPGPPAAGDDAVLTGQHTDYGAITLLATDGVPGPGGAAARRHVGAVVAPPGSLVVNLGDMLARWTNDRYVSTPHRVVSDGTERLSIPFFVNPDPDDRGRLHPVVRDAGATVPLRADHRVGVPPGSHRRHHRPRRRPSLSPAEPVPPILDLQLNPSTGPWTDLRDRACAAEAAGYGARWTFDHLGGLSLRGDTMFESFTLLGALAASTATIELGVLVANVFNRTPALLGVAAATLEAIADRPVHLGLGAGAAPDSRWSAEMRAVGQPVAATVGARHERVADTLDVLDRLYDPGRDTALATFPLPRRRPTVVLGVNGVTLAELAGRRADGVNVGWEHPRRDELLDVARRARGDRPGFVVTTWLGWEPELLDPRPPDPAGDGRAPPRPRGADRPGCGPGVGAGGPGPSVTR